jgi:hypothetical protein
MIPKNNKADDMFRIKLMKVDVASSQSEVDSDEENEENKQNDSYFLCPPSCSLQLGYNRTKSHQEVSKKVEGMSISPFKQYNLNLQH